MVFAASLRKLCDLRGGLRGDVKKSTRSPNGSWKQAMLLGTKGAAPQLAAQLLTEQRKQGYGQEGGYQRLRVKPGSDERQEAHRQLWGCLKGTISKSKINCFKMPT